MRPGKGRALRLAVLMLLPAAAHADAATHAELAAQVNAQIVLRQVNQGVAMMAEGSGAGFIPRDLPAACEPAMRDAVAGMTTELVRFMQDTFNDPAYQRRFEQQLQQAYSAQQLQAFLDRSNGDMSGTVNADVMAAPGLQDAQDAHLAQLTQSADAAMEADPRLQQALSAVRVATDGCDAERMRGGAES